MTTIAHIITQDAVTIYIDGAVHTVSSDSDSFSAVIDAVNAGDADEVTRLVSTAKQTISDLSDGEISYCGETNTLRYGDYVLDIPAITTRLYQLWVGGYKYDSLLRFVDRLRLNPSYRAVQELYRFLEACNLPITSDGHFLAWKMVRNDYTDIYSGRFDNSIGATPSMPRNEVDEDSDRTCSRGLHVCSKEYLGNYGYSSNSDRVMVVKVDPADVVAVPRDYNNSKMRTSGYEVIGEVSWEDVGLERFTDWERFTEDDLLDCDDDDDGSADLSGILFEYTLSGDFFDGECEYDIEVEGINPFSTFDEPSSLEDEDGEEEDDDFNEPVLPRYLTADVVKEIKLRLKRGHYDTIVGLANEYGRDESTIRKIRDGVTWSHVKV